MLSVKKLIDTFSLAKSWLENLYSNNQTSILIQRLWDKIRICFRYSFLGRITELKEENSLLIWDNSIFFNWLLNKYKILKYKIINYTKTSIVLNLIKK